MARETLPEAVRKLFWDVDLETVDLVRHRDFMLERVMSRGGWDAMCWLRRTITPGVLADFVRRKGDRLAPREQAYWALISGVEIESRRGGGTAPWATRA